MLRATTACTFLTSQLPKVVREWCVLYILTWKCTSRHNGVQFFISHLASWLRTRRFSEPTFRPSRATSHKSLEIHSESRLSYLFAHLHLLSSDLFSSDSSHLCFSTVHIVGSFTSKLPSIMNPNYKSFCVDLRPLKVLHPSCLRCFSVLISMHMHIYIYTHLLLSLSLSLSL